MRPSKKPKEFVFSRREPDLPADLELLVDPAPLLDSRDSRIVGLKMEGRTGGNLHLSGTVLEQACLSNNTFATISCKDVRFVGCDLANVQTRSLTLVRVEFLDCRMTGFHGGEADCRDVLVSAGDQRYSEFRFSRFQSAEFTSCNFAEADFQGTDLSGSIFRNCNLQGAEMSKVKLMNADLRGSRVDGLRINAGDVRGAVVDLEQALIFSRLLGIRIE